MDKCEIRTLTTLLARFKYHSSQFCFFKSGVSFDGRMRPEDVRLQVALLSEPVTTVQTNLRHLPWHVFYFHKGCFFHKWYNMRITSLHCGSARLTTTGTDW